MTFRRLPDDLDPRRPPETGQEDRDELEDFEDVTDEVAREGDDHPDDEAPPPRGRPRRKELEEREEFEDLTGEVTREEDEDTR